MPRNSIERNLIADRVLVMDHRLRIAGRHIEKKDIAHARRSEIKELVHGCKADTLTRSIDLSDSMSVIDLILAILGAAGGSAVLVAGLGAWLGKVWAARIRESDRARFQREIERLRSDLEVSRAQLNRISEAQFSLYSQVWMHLQDLKVIGDQLWERATIEKLHALGSALAHAQLAIHRGRLIMVEAHYQELLRILSDFAQYQVGKARLIEIRSQQELEENFQLDLGQRVIEQIGANGAVRERYGALLDEVVHDFRQQLGFEKNQRRQNCPP